jgi:hypothetical protein
VEKLQNIYLDPCRVDTYAFEFCSVFVGLSSFGCFVTRGRRQVNGGVGLQIWRVVTSILSEQVRKAGKV